MDYKISKPEKSQITITVTVPEERMKDFRKKACEDISHEVKVKGFRPGHVPPHVLEEHVEKKYIEAHTQEIAIQKTYAEIVVKEKIQVVARPKVKIEKESPLTYEATVAILPKVEIQDYKSIKVPKKEVEATEKDVEAVVEDMMKYGTTYKDVDRVAKKDDRVEVDFEGFDEKGKELPSTKSKNHPVIIGQGSLVGGFEDNLIGMKKDEKKEFTVTFPKDYQKKDFQNKKVTFKAEVKRVEEPSKPELNDEFVEKMTGKKRTVEEFKKDIEKNIQARKAQELEKDRENKYLEELLKKTKIEIPEALVDEEVEYILEDMKQEISMKGMEFDKFLEQTKTSEDDLRKKYRPEGERRIKIRLALRYMIEKEGIKPTDEEVKKEFELTKRSYPEKEHDKIQKEFDSGNLNGQLVNKIALKKLFEVVLK